MKIPHLAGLIYCWDCIAENFYIKHAKLPACGVWDGAPREEKVIISLTSFPARIDTCYYAIKSLMLQSYKADRIILWLAENQFPAHSLPKKLDDLVDRGLEIRYCEDLRAHKKYYHALQEQQAGEVVITYDDDIIYEADSVWKLIEQHRQYPRCIICNRGHFITTGQDGKVDTYRKWKVCSPEGVGRPAMMIMPSTGAGCLYPHNVMPATTFDVNLIKDYASTADDIWMCFNRLSAGVPVVKTREKTAILCNVSASQKEALTKINDLGHENERTIERLEKLFPGVLSSG